MVRVRDEDRRRQAAAWPPIIRWSWRTPQMFSLQADEARRAALDEVSEPWTMAEATKAFRS